jgi:Na+/melibiose symporter-like transporter
MGSRQLSVFAKTAYGVGQLAEGIKNSSFELFLFFYYNQVLGLSGSLTGLATLIALAVDAVTDPMAGSFSDGFRHRWGRRHPFIYAAAIPLGFFFALLFRPPPGLHGTGLFLWLTLLAVLVRVAMTVYHVPHLALGAELSDDYRERTTIVAYRIFFAVGGAALASLIGLGYFFRASPAFPNGQLDQAAYPTYARFFGVLMAASVVASAAGTHARIPFLRQPEHELEPFNLRRVAREMREALANRSFRSLFFGVVIFFVMRGVQMSLNLHLWTYFWRLPTRQILDVNLAMLFGVVVGIVFWTRASVHLDKKPTFLTGIAFFSVFSVLPPLLKIWGWFPEYESPAYLTALLLIGGLIAFSAAAGLVAAGSMMADITDEHELLTGRRQEGIFFGALAFAGKSASGVGHQIAGLGIDAIGFPAQATPGSVPPGVVDALGVLCGPGVGVLAVIALVVLARYHLNRHRHAEIVTELERRRSRARRVPDRDAQLRPSGTG